MSPSPAPRHRRARRRAHRRLLAAVVVALLVAGTIAAVLLGSSGGGSRTARRVRVAATATSTSTSTVATAPTTTTTVDPGTLPQTMAHPRADDPSFQARMQALWSAIVTDDLQRAMPAFFPLSAYLQVKAISDPAHDWQTRLVAAYDADIHQLHTRLGAAAAGAALTGVDVPDAQAQWVLPGAEYNKGSYWRVYGTTVHYTLGAQAGAFTIASLISWRGQWYVVHLAAIR